MFGICIWFKELTTDIVILNPWFWYTFIDGLLLTQLSWGADEVTGLAVIGIESNDDL